MANKNTRKLRKAIRAAGKKGEDSITVSRPVYNYHNFNAEDHRKGSTLRNVTFPCVGKPNQDGVISGKTKRNMGMRVYVNRGEANVGTCSMTCHEPLSKGIHVIPKNHKYMEYRPFPK